MQLIDEVKINVRSGDGGDGCCSFRREKFIPKGGPDGGNGGKGGDIIFSPNPNVNTLVGFRYTRHFKAQRGCDGAGRNKTGASAQHMVLDIPIGTEILDETGKYVLYDASQQKDIIFLKGGNGGAGNSNFKSSTNRAPQKFTKGEEGQERWIWLKLKLLADIGIIGLPNIGKSSLLANLTKAKPKIGNYAFTTLAPCLGVMEHKEKEVVLADIPGLIEGAHEGKGLGVRFLKHIERCKLLLHLIDANSSDIEGDYRKIREELAQYSQKLLSKPEIICLSRADIKSSNVDSELFGNRLHQISTYTNSGITKLQDIIIDALQSI